MRYLSRLIFFLCQIFTIELFSSLLWQRIFVDIMEKANLDVFSKGTEEEFNNFLHRVTQVGKFGDFELATVIINRVCLNI